MTDVINAVAVEWTQQKLRQSANRLSMKTTTNLWRIFRWSCRTGWCRHPDRAGRERAPPSNLPCCLRSCSSRWACSSTFPPPAPTRPRSSSLRAGEPKSYELHRGCISGSVVRRTFWLFFCVVEVNSQRTVICYGNKFSF